MTDPINRSGLVDTSFVVNSLPAGKYKVTITAKNSSGSTESLSSTTETYAPPPAKVTAVPAMGGMATISFYPPTYPASPNKEMSSGYAVTWDGLTTPVYIPPLTPASGVLEAVTLPEKTTQELGVTDVSVKNFGKYSFTIPITSLDRVKTIQVASISAAGTSPVYVINEASRDKLPETMATPNPTVGFSLSNANELSYTFPLTDTLFSSKVSLYPALETDVKIFQAAYNFVYGDNEFDQWSIVTLDRSMNFDDKSMSKITGLSSTSGVVTLPLFPSNATLKVDTRVALPISIDDDGFGDYNANTLLQVETVNNTSFIDPPRSLMVSSITKNSASFTWARPEKLTKPLTGYTLYIYKGTSLVNSVDVGNVNYHTLNGLSTGPSGIEYTVVVVANGDGAGSSTLKEYRCLNTLIEYKWVTNGNVVSFVTVPEDVKLEGSSVATSTYYRIKNKLPTEARSGVVSYCLETDSIDYSFIPSKTLNCVDKLVGYVVTFGALTAGPPTLRYGKLYQGSGLVNYGNDKTADFYVSDIIKTDQVNNNGRLSTSFSDIRQKLKNCGFLEPTTYKVKASAGSNTFTVVEPKVARVPTGNVVGVFTTADMGKAVKFSTASSWRIKVQTVIDIRTSYESSKVYATTGGSGKGMSFTVSRSRRKVYAVRIVDFGTGYKDGDILTIEDSWGTIIEITLTNYVKILYDGKDTADMIADYRPVDLKTKNNVDFTFANKKFSFHDDFEGYFTLLDVKFDIPAITVCAVYEKPVKRYAGVKLGYVTKIENYYLPVSTTRFNYAVNNWFFWDKDKPFDTDDLRNINPEEVQERLQKGDATDLRATQNKNAPLGPYWWLKYKNFPPLPVDVPRAISVNSITASSARIDYSPPFYYNAAAINAVAAVAKSSIVYQNQASNGKVYLGFKPKYDYKLTLSQEDVPERTSTETYPLVEPEFTFTAPIQNGTINLTGLSPDTEYVVGLYLDSSNLIRPATFTFRTLMDISDIYTPPTNVNATVSTSSTTLTWTAPRPGGSYLVLLSGPVDGGCGRFSTTNLTYTCTNLLPNSRYVAKILYKGSDGKASSPASITFTTSTI